MKNHRFSRVLQLGAVMALVLASNSNLQAQILLNGSFETGSVGVGANPVVTQGVATNWTLSGNVIVQEFDFLSGNPNYLVGVTNGNRALAFNPSNAPATGIASQTFATTSGLQYTLTFDFGKYGPDPAGDAFMNYLVTGTGTLLSGTVSDTTGSSYELSGGNAEAYSSYSFSFTADSASTTLTFSDASTNNGNAFDTALDNVAVSVVPEPTTWALFGIGTGLLVVLRRFSKIA